MRKSGAVWFFSMIVVLGAVGCGGGPCGELEDVQKECCDKAADQATKDQCYEIVDAQNNSSATDEICEAAKTAFVCNIP